MKKLAVAVNRILLAVLLISVFVWNCENNSFAASDTDPYVISSRTTDDGIYVYVKNVVGITEGTTVQIGNANCDSFSYGAILAQGLPIKTVILLDNSLSFSGIWGEKGKEFIAGMIDCHAENEQYSLYTFSDSLQQKSEYTDNYELLKSAVQGIAYENQDSFLTDALYVLLTQLKTEQSGGFTRVIVIADGADENEITYTESELKDLMKECQIPVYSVGAKGANNNKELEKLFSYSRLTNAGYFMVEKNSEYSDIVSAMQGDYSIEYLLIDPDEQLLTGEKKEAKMVLNTMDGEKTVTTTVQMPFGTGEQSGEDVDSSETEDFTLESAQDTPEDTENVDDNNSSEETIVDDSSDSEDDAVEDIEDEVDKNESDEEEKGFPIIPVAVGGAVLACGIIAAVVILVIRKRNQSPDDNTEERTQMGTENGSDPAPWDMDKTVVLNEGDSGKTEILFDSGSESVITLSDMNKPGKKFSAAIRDRIVVGRTVGADIVIDYDQSVSSRHCEFIKRGNEYILKDLGSSNHTKYDGNRVDDEVRISNGGILEIGRGRYSITIE